MAIPTSAQNRISTITNGNADVVALTSNTAANPTVFTTGSPHGLWTGDIISISGVGGGVLPTSINGGPFTVTVIGPQASSTSFSIPVNCTHAGTGGSCWTGGPDFWIALPNAPGQGNCVFLGLSYMYGAARTVVIKDYATLSDAQNAVNVVDTWPAADVSVTDAGNQITSSIYRLKNAAGGGQYLRITFDAPVQSVQMVLDEWYNVDIAAAADTTWSNNLSSQPTVDCGSSQTPGHNGDLIWEYAVQVGALVGNGAGSTLTGMTAGTNFTLRVNDWAIGTLCQAYVQPTAAAVNPTFTSSGTSTQGYNALALAVRAASAGTPPPANKVRVNFIQHTRDCQPLANGASWATGFPSEGNYIAFMSSAGVGRGTVVTDTSNNLYSTVFNVNNPAAMANFAINAATGPTLAVTITLTAGQELQGLLYDVSNYSNFDFDNFVDSGNIAVAANATISDAPRIIPDSVYGLVLTTCPFGTGPPSGNVGSTPDCVFDSIHYTGQKDSSAGFTSGDGYQHSYMNDPTTVSFWYTVANGGQSTTADGLAVGILGPLPGTPGGTVLGQKRKIPIQQRLG